MAAGRYGKAADLPQRHPVFPLRRRHPAAAGRAAAQHLRAALSEHDRRRHGRRPAHRHGPAAGAGGSACRPGSPIGCAGRITSFAETSDGRYLITLTGLCRFRWAELPTDRPCSRPSRLPRCRRQSAPTGRGGPGQLQTLVDTFSILEPVGADQEPGAARPRSGPRRHAGRPRRDRPWRGRRASARGWIDPAVTAKPKPPPTMNDSTGRSRIDPQLLEVLVCPLDQGVRL